MAFETWFETWGPDGLAGQDAVLAGEFDGCEILGEMVRRASTAAVMAPLDKWTLEQTFAVRE